MPNFKLSDIPYFDKMSAVHGLFDPNDQALVKDTRTLIAKQKEHNKVLPSLEAAIEYVGLRDGMTISFHHHFRNGDYVVNMVMETIAKMGFRNLTVAASSLNEIHEPMIGHIKNGVVTHIETSGLRGKLADAVSDGLMDFPVIFRSHGGRASAIETGELHIDVAFLGAPTSDPYGNANGYSRETEENGTSCGSLGYAKIDAMYADKCVIITDTIVPFPNAPFGIPESQVDCVVKVDKVGDSNKIMSGATRFTTNPKELLIAQIAALVIENSGYFNDGFSMQMGSGGASLAVARFIREKMLERNIKARFALGGITGQIVEMHEEGLVQRILDVQSFDLVAAKSLKNNRFHQQIDASYYASYLNRGAAVNQLDFAVLSAMEIDVNFNVNVLTGSNGVIRGAIGGHPDAAAGASMTVIVTPLMRGRIPCVLSRVNTVVTPGRSVDVVVTCQGTAVNPNRPDLLERFQKAGGIELCTMEELRDRAERLCGKPAPNDYADRIVGLSLYRDNTVLDVIRQVKN